MKRSCCRVGRQGRRLLFQSLESRLPFAADLPELPTALPEFGSSHISNLSVSNPGSVVALAAAQSAAEHSIRDRIVNADGYEAFKAAALGPATSPALSNVISGDLVVTSTETIGANVTAVVHKPRSSAAIYQIPKPATNENAFAFLRAHLTSAASSGAGRVVFPANHHFKLVPPNPEDQSKFGPFDQQEHLTITGMHDVVLDLNGSTLEFTNRSLGIRIVDSSRVVLRNGTIRGSGVLSTIAKVMPDSGPAGIRFEVLPQYRALIEQTWTESPPLITVGGTEQGEDGNWRLDASGYGELFTNRGKPTNNFIYRNGSYVSTSKLLRDINPFTPNRDHVWLLHYNNSGHAILLDNTKPLSDITFEDLTFTNIPGMVVAGELDRGLHVNRVRIQTDATNPALLAASSDEIHINANGGDIVIENSYFGPNGDDKITIKGNYWKVAQVDRNSNTLTVVPVDRGSSLSRWGADDDKVVFIDSNYGVLGTAKLAADTIRNANNRHVLKLESIPDNIKINSIIGNVDRSGGRVIIRNNEFNETRAQGVLVQSNHVVVESNRFTGIAGPPIKLNLAQELWYEAINTNNVHIKNNEFSRSSFSSTKPAELIYFHQFDGSGKAIEIIDDVKIVGNRLSGSTQPPVDPPPVDPPPVSPTVRLLYENKETRVTSDKIGAQIDLINDGSSAIDLKGVEFRYRMTADGLTPIVRIRSTSAPSAGVVGSYNQSGSYASFKIENSVVVAAGARLRVRFEITNAQRMAFNQGNDESFIPNQVSAAPNARIDLLVPGSGVIPPNPQPNPGPQNPSPDPGLPRVRIVYLQKSPRQLTNEIEGQIEVFNDGTGSQNLLGMEVRYYLNPDSLTPSIKVTSASSPMSGIAASYASEGYASFLITEDINVGAGDRLKFRFVISNAQNQTFDQSNDRSYVAGLTKRSETDAIDVWYQQQRIWGQANNAASSASVSAMRKNPSVAQDVNNDGHVTPLDALRVINQISRNRTAQSVGEQVDSGPFLFADVNGDGMISALDALMVINHVAAGHRAVVNAQEALDESLLGRLATSSASDLNDNDEALAEWDAGPSLF